MSKKLDRFPLTFIFLGKNPEEILFLALGYFEDGLDKENVGTPHFLHREKALIFWGPMFGFVFSMYFPIGEV